MISPDVLGTVFGRVPQALLTKPSDVRSNLDFLAGWIQSSGAMTRVVAKVPLALVFSRQTMDKRLEYLRDELQLPTDVIGKVVVANPDILQWSIERRIETAIDDLALIVGRQAVAQVITKLPAILGIMDGVPSRLYWLREVAGLSDAEIGSVIRRAPAILTYSVSGNLNPKWSFIHKTMGATRPDLVEAPREILCANLQQRAMPRYAFTVSKLAAAAADIKVTDMLGGCDVEFCRNVVHCDPKEYRKFVEEDRYLLFFSQLM
jgi:mTERF